MATGTSKIPRESGEAGKNWPTPVNKPDFWPVVGSILLGVVIGLTIAIVLL